MSSAPAIHFKRITEAVTTRSMLSHIEPGNQLLSPGIRFEKYFFPLYSLNRDSILGWGFLHAVHYQQFDRALARLKAQPQLFRQGSENRGERAAIRG